MSELLDSVIVHDLKNRLALLADSLARLQPLTDTGEARELAACSHAQALALTHRLSGLLLTQRLASGRRLPVHLQEESPLQLLEELADDARLLSGGRLQIEAQALEQAQQQLPAAWVCDRHLLRLALDSALYNALHYARSHIRLTVALDADGMLVFSIADDGPGPEAAAPGEHSSGLGLQVCTAVAQAHRNRAREGQSRLSAGSGGGALYELRIP
ncbi:sensor histidine kinase [Pelomonas sp. V22]|uniref:sensor histidine kinase n=1 Tax=Pelomonas sp. V22 TaxID=2822139 RepID=UPI0024A83BDF|nr:ATP-binding protein [Pelomonas sp. V22]MDI4632227.1 sensor histidine kinase [Pelomonas sp. V22]